MDKTEHQQRTHLFTVRVWLEQLGRGQAEWRGEVQYVVSGEMRYFRNWPTLVALLQTMLPKTDPVWQQIGSLNEPGRQGEHLMSIEENKAIVRRFEEVFNEKRVDRADEFVAQDYIDHAALPGQAPGLEGAKQKWAMFIAATPDMRVLIEDMVAEGDKVVARWTYEGTHHGELLGIPPTGKRFRTSGISIYRLAKGKVAEVWEEFDRLGMLQQLGVVPARGQGGS